MDDIDKTMSLESKYMKEIYEKVKQNEEDKSNQKNDVSLNNFEQTVMEMLILLHIENKAMLYAHIKEESANELSEMWDEVVNKIFKSHFNTKVL